MSQRTKDLVTQGTLEATEGPKAGDNSRSGWLFDAACSLIREGVPDEIVLSILSDQRFAVSSSVLDKGRMAHDYAVRQVARAREEVEHEQLVLSAGEPLKSARQFVRREMPTLMRFKDDWLSHDGAAYVAHEDDTVKAAVYQFLDRAVEPAKEGRACAIQAHPCEGG